MKPTGCVKWMIMLSVAMIFTVTGLASAAEVITAQDIQENVVTKEALVRTADNVIVLVDTSSSMAFPSKKYKPKTKYQLEKEALASGISRLPELGYNLGIYSFTPWKEIYPVQPFDPATAAASLDKLPAEASGTTPLVQGLQELENVLSGLSGKSVVYIFSDGGYDREVAGMAPGQKALEVADKYNVCFMIVSHSADPDGRKRVRDMGKANPCSRVIPFDSYITDPYYALAPLYYVRSDTEVVTTSEQVVKGMKVNNILFEYDKSELRPEAQQELDALGTFLQEHPNASAYFVGYTDSVGSEGYNLGLSERRAEAAASYVGDKFGIDSTRLVTTWYGEINPVADNDTEEGRALNRRVEIAVGGF